MIDAHMRVITENGRTDILNQYICFSKVLDANVEKFGRNANAVNETIKICRTNNILKDFLENHEKEATDIMVTLFNQQEAVANYGASERAEGQIEGRELVAINMLKRGHSVADTASLAELPLQRVQELDELIKKKKL